jgi:phenylacetate-coenzyme A ligase PaaK-like adenylate-forming protein
MQVWHSRAMKLMHHTPRWDSTSHDEWEAWQTRRLHDYLKHRVFPFSAHYRRIFEDHDFRPGDLRSLADWAQLPMTSKADLTVPRELQREFVLVPEEHVIRHEPQIMMHALLHGRASAKRRVEHEFRPVLLTSTTGRSSEPVPFVYTQHDLDNLNVTGRRLMECGRSSTEYRHVNTFPYAPHLAFWQAHHASIGFGTFMVSTGGGKTLGTLGNINMIDKIQPDVLIGMPTFLYHLLREAVEMGKHWPNLKRVVLGGEKTAQGLRANLRDLCHELGGEVHIVSTYGFTEAKMAFPECCSSTGITPTGFHLSPDLGIVELVDPKTGHLVQPGQGGEIVFTPLNSRGTVVLRYRTGDIAEGGLVWGECPHCGRIGPRLMGPISRVSEVRSLKLDKVKGTLVDFNMLEHLLDDQKGIAAWQIELRKRDNDPLEIDEVVLHVTPESGVTPAELEHMVEHRFHQATELTPNAIVCHSMEEMRHLLGVGRLLKEEKVVDHRNATSNTMSSSH